MLDDEPNDTSTPSAEAPPVKAARRRRATKATAAPTPVELPGDAAPADTAPADAAPADTAPADAAPADTAPADPAPADPAPADPAPADPAPADPAPADTAPADTAPGDIPPADADPATAKRVRKAPAKKAAPRKRAAKAVPPAEGPVGDLSPDDAAVAEALQAPTAPVVEGLEADPAVAPGTGAVPEAGPTGTDGSTETPALQHQAAEPGLGETRPEPVAEVQPDDAAADEPAPSRRRRRAPAIVTFQAPEPDPGPAVADEPAADDDAAPAPRRRRRAGTTGALPAAALAPTLLAPEQAPAPAEEDAATEETDGEGPEAEDDSDRPRRRRRGRRGRGPRREDGDEAAAEDGVAETEPVAAPPEAVEDDEDEPELDADGTRRRRRRRRRSGGAGSEPDESADDVPTVVHVREPRTARVRGASAADEDGVRGITGSTRMAAKRARRQEGRDSGRRRPPVLSEAEFLARREAVDRTMVVRQQGDRTQIAVLEDGVLVEHYVTKASAQAYAGNVYLGKVQNVLPSMEAAFVDIGKGKNGVLYAGEVNYDAQLAGNGPRKIEQVLKSGQDVLVQVSKDPIGHKGARLTSQVSLPGRYLVYVPEGSMTGISRKLPDTERARLKAILKQIVPDDAGVIIRTAAEGASEEELTADVRRLQAQWEVISTKVAQGGGPVLLHAEPDLVVRVVRDVFNEDFTSLVVQGDSEWDTIKEYVDFVAPDLAPRLARHESDVDVFAVHRIDEQLAKALDRKVWLPSGGSLVIDRTEAMVVVDVNTGKYVGKGGNLEETVTRNNLEAAEEIARQLRLRDLGGIIVVDFIDMVLESNRDLVVRRLVECLGRDRTKHQVAEVTSLGLVQMTRKRVGQGLLESFSETCEACGGRGVLVHPAPTEVRGERGPRDRKQAAAAAALVAAASAAAHVPAGPAAAPAAEAPTPPTPDGAEPAEREAGSGRGRRRRGGRGAGAAAAAGATVAQGDADQDPAEVVPDLVPEVEQLPPAEENQPVLLDGEPAGGGPGAGGAVDGGQVDGGQVDGGQVEGGQVDDGQGADGGLGDVQLVDAPPVDASPMDDAPPADVLAGDAAPEAVEGAPAPAGDEPRLRRRRRATSRPVGPPS